MDVGIRVSVIKSVESFLPSAGLLVQKLFSARGIALSPSKRVRDTDVLDTFGGRHRKQGRVALPPPITKHPQKKNLHVNEQKAKKHNHLTDVALHSRVCLHKTMHKEVMNELCTGQETVHSTRLIHKAVTKFL